jgi:hypothetical protein
MICADARFLCGPWPSSVLSRRGIWQRLIKDLNRASPNRVGVLCRANTCARPQDRGWTLNSRGGAAGV